jgi:hypothetical protein
MSNDLMRPFMRPFDPDTARAIEEIAKFGTKLLDSGGKAAGYVTGIFGHLPHNVVGFLSAF